MLLSLRALFFSVPALIVLIGGYYVAPGDPSLEEGVQPGSSFVASVDWPTEKDEDLVRRVAIKQEAVLDLLDGRITLSEALDRFRLISTAAGSDASESARFVQQVISFARAYAVRDPGRYQEACERLESAARDESRRRETSGLLDSRSPFGS